MSTGRRRILETGHPFSLPSHVRSRPKSFYGLESSRVSLENRAELTPASPPRRLAAISPFPLSPPSPALRFRGQSGHSAIHALADPAKSSAAWSFPSSIADRMDGPARAARLHGFAARLLWTTREDLHGHKTPFSYNLRVLLEILIEHPTVICLMTFGITYPG